MLGKPNSLLDLQLLGLGALAGFTIFLGLPVARFQTVSPKAKGLLNAISIGILLFLLIEVIPSAQKDTQKTILNSVNGTAPIGEALLFGVSLLGGFAFGLLSLVWYENRFIGFRKSSDSAYSPLTGPVDKEAYDVATAKRLAMMIAVGLGVHNFSEGLAIGSQYVSGALTLAFLLIIGFGAHNATEGFGIAAPLVGSKPKWSFLLTAGLVGGGPTFLGTMAGSVFVSPALSVLFLAIAGGALFFVIMTLYGAGRRQVSNQTLMTGIFLGFLAGYFTDLLLVVTAA